MKFSGFSLLFLTAAYAQNEVELMEAKKADRAHHGSVNVGMCNNKPLDPYMLIARVR